MAKKFNVKTEIKKLLDKTDLQEVKSSGLLDKIKCYIKCYGGYLLAVGAGCYFGKNLWIGLALLVVAGIWGYKVNCNHKIYKR